MTLINRAGAIAFLFILSSLTTVSITLADTPTDIKSVQSDVANVLKAVNELNVDETLKYTWKGVIEKMGGENSAKKQLTDAYKKLKDANIKFTQIEFPTPPKFFQLGKRFFVIVPVKSIMILAASNQKLSSSNFYLGVREAKTDPWTYLDGSRIRSDNIGVFFPEFPSNYDFPKPVMKVLQ